MAAATWTGRGCGGVNCVMNARSCGWGHDTTYRTFAVLDAELGVLSPDDVIWPLP